MTIHEAARSFHHAHEYAPWLVGVASLGKQIIVYTKFDLPEPLKEQLATWEGWTVEFHVSGRVCLE